MTSRLLNKYQAGLTLLETMIVMAILALVMGIAGTSYQRFFSSQDNKAKELTALSEQIQTFRLKAMALGKMQELELGSIFSSEVTLCDGFTNNKVIFHKNGTVAIGPICIMDLENVQKTILVDWVTGATTFAD